MTYPVNVSWGTSKFDTASEKGVYDLEATTSRSLAPSSAGLRGGGVRRCPPALPHIHARPPGSTLLLTPPEETPLWRPNFLGSSPGPAPF